MGGRPSAMGHPKVAHAFGRKVGSEMNDTPRKGLPLGPLLFILHEFGKINEASEEGKHDLRVRSDER